MDWSEDGVGELLLDELLELLDWLLLAELELLELLDELLLLDNVRTLIVEVGLVVVVLVGLIELVALLVAEETGITGITTTGGIVIVTVSRLLLTSGSDSLDTISTMLVILPSLKTLAVIRISFCTPTNKVGIVNVRFWPLIVGVIGLPS